MLLMPAVHVLLLLVVSGSADTCSLCPAIGTDQGLPPATELYMDHRQRESNPDVVCLPSKLVLQCRQGRGTCRSTTLQRAALPSLPLSLGCSRCLQQWQTRLTHWAHYDVLGTVRQAQNLAGSIGEVPGTNLPEAMLTPSPQLRFASFTRLLTILLQANGQKDGGLQTRWSPHIGQQGMRDLFDRFAKEAKVR